MARSGGRPGARSTGQRIRLLAKETAPYLPELPISDLVRSYHEFWSDFVPLPVGVCDTVELVRGELEQQYLYMLTAQLGVTLPRHTGEVRDDIDSRMRWLLSRKLGPDGIRRADHSLSDSIRSAVKSTSLHATTVEREGQS